MESKTADLDSSSKQKTLTLDVRSTDLPPIIESSPTVRAAAATTYRYQLVAYDLLGRALNYSLTSSAGTAAAISATGEVTWVVPAGSTATHTF